MIFDIGRKTLDKKIGKIYWFGGEEMVTKQSNTIFLCVLS
jgi:hypothetical protein